MKPVTWLACSMTAALALTACKESMHPAPSEEPAVNAAPQAESAPTTATTATSTKTAEAAKAVADEKHEVTKPRKHHATTNRRRQDSRRRASGARSLRVELPQMMIEMLIHQASPFVAAQTSEEAVRQAVGA